MRALFVLIIGLAVGFGAGWAAFTKPWDTAVSKPPAASMTAKDVQVAVLRHENGAYRSATCVRRQYPTDTWDCALVANFGIPRTEMVKVHGTSVDFRRAALDYSRLGNTR